MLMKTVMALTFLASSTAFAAQVTVLENFDPKTKTYTAKINSTSEAPRSAKALVTPGNGVCFSGETPEIADLLGVMIAQLNGEGTGKSYSLLVVGKNPDQKTWSLTLSYFASDLDKGTITWSQIPKCLK